MSKRRRKYRYSSLVGYLPTGLFWLILSILTLPITFFRFVDGNWTYLGLHIGLIFFLAVIRPNILPWLRRSSLREVARELGLNYRWKGEINWLPPDYVHCPDEQWSRNILSGTIDDLSVIVFDSQIERTYCSRDEDHHTRTRTSTRAEYSVVQLQGQASFPTCLISSQSIAAADGYPFPDTGYSISPRTGVSQSEIVPFFTKPVAEFLKSLPGLIIELNGSRLTAYDSRRFTNRVRTAANLPAFVEDLFHLYGLLIDAQQQGAATSTDNSPLFAQAKARYRSRLGKYRNDRLYPITKRGGNDPVNAFGAFGLLWTAICVVAFPLLFVTGAFDEAGVLYFFAPVFTLAGVAMLTPWLRRQLNRSRRAWTDPVIRVEGDYPQPEGKLTLRIQPGSQAESRASDVRLTLTLSQRAFPEGAGGMTVGPAILNRWMQELFLLPDQSNLIWSSEKTHDLETGPEGDSLFLEETFSIPDDTSLETLAGAWWGIDVDIATKGEPIYKSTYHLPAPTTIGSSLVFPTIILGAVWGFFGFALLTIGFMESLTGGTSGATFGFVALMAFGGVFVGGFVGGKIGGHLYRTALFRPVAEQWERMHFLFQFLLSFVLAMVSFFATIYLADDVFNVFGWRDASEVAESGTDANRPTLSVPASGEQGDRQSRTGLSREQVNQYMRSVETNDHQTVKKLVAAHPQLLETPLPPAGGTALHRAALYGREPMAKWLLKQGASVTATNNNGGTPLHVAAHNGHLPLVKLLITAGADRTAPNKSGHTPLELAKRKNHQEVVAYLGKR